MILHSPVGTWVLVEMLSCALGYMSGDVEQDKPQ